MKLVHTITEYSTLALGAVVVTVMFSSATTYAQLAVAILLFFPLAYYALQVVSPYPSAPKQQPEGPYEKNEKVIDIDKRAFLKIIGVAGISYFFFSVIGRKLDVLSIGKTVGLVKNTPEPLASQEAGPPVTSASPPIVEGYKIAEIDEGIDTYYGFVDKDGAWFIMKEDTQASSFRYVKGNSDFPGNWSKRTKLNYDYYYNIF